MGPIALARFKNKGKLKIKREKLFGKKKQEVDTNAMRVVFLDKSSLKQD